MTIATNMNYKWQKKTSSITGLDDIFDFPADTTPEQRILIEEMCIASSFFLPATVLNNSRYQISPVYVLPGSDLVDLAKYIDIPIITFSDFEFAGLIWAKNVGVSIRFDCFTKKTIVVFKLWFGKNPWEGKGNVLDTVIRHDRVLKMAKDYERSSKAANTGKELS